MTTATPYKALHGYTIAMPACPVCGQTIVPDNDGEDSVETVTVEQPPEEQTARTKLALKNFMTRMKVTPALDTRVLWDQLVVHQQADRFTVLFPLDFYNKNTKQCYVFLGRLCRRAHSRNFRAWFTVSETSGYLTVVAPMWKR